MGEALAARYWCYMCSEMVNPVVEVEMKCPFCDGGFVEEMGGRGDMDSTTNMGSDQALSLWAPILLGMMGGSSRRRRHHREEEDEEEEGDEEGELDRDRDFESILRRSRRRSAAIHRLLEGIRAQIASISSIASESSNSEGNGERERQGERESEQVILINPFNQAIILQGSFDTNETQNQNTDTPGTGVSLGDYFVGPGLDLLLQYLAENDPNRYNTPAKKEAVEALPTVKIEENLQCSVCLEDFDIGTEAKEMPCKHRYHNGCILPWLELHNSCPVCRFQLPADESKDSSGSDNGHRVENNGSSAEIEGAADRDSGGNGRRFWVPVPWPFNELFSLSGSRGSNSHPDES